MNMVEKGARAWHEERRREWGEAGRSLPAWEKLAENQRIALLRYQRAAIKAWRVSTSKMNIAGVKAMEASAESTATTAVIFGQPKDVWQAMVDEALKE